MDLDTQTEGPNQATAAPALEAQAPSITDIDSLSEFQFQGQKYTPEKLNQIFSEHKSFGETRKEFEERKKFEENLQYDFDRVLDDPSLAEKFKSMYPKSYHAVLDRALALMNRPDASNKETTQGQVPESFLKEFNQLKGKVGEFERARYEAEVAKNEAYLQRVVDPLFEKYSYASPDAVYAKANALISDGYKMTDAAWERLIKENHSAIEKRADERHQQKLKQQIEKGSQAKDTGPGGAAPGQAPPKGPRTLSQATEEFVRKMTKSS